MTRNTCSHYKDDVQWACICVNITFRGHI